MDFYHDDGEQNAEKVQAAEKENDQKACGHHCQNNVEELTIKLRCYFKSQLTCGLEELTSKDVEPIASDKPSKLPFKICNIFGCVHEENLKFVILTDSIQFQAAEIELVAKEYMALDFILSRMSKIPSLLSITEYSADKLSVLRTLNDASLEHWAFNQEHLNNSDPTYIAVMKMDTATLTFTVTKINGCLKKDEFKFPPHLRPICYELAAQDEHFLSFKDTATLTFTVTKIIGCLKKDKFKFHVFTTEGRYEVADIKAVAKQNLDIVLSYFLPRIQRVKNTCQHSKVDRDTQADEYNEKAAGKYCDYDAGAGYEDGGKAPDDFEGGGKNANDFEDNDGEDSNFALHDDFNHDDGEQNAEKVQAAEKENDQKACGHHCQNDVEELTIKLRCYFKIQLTCGLEELTSKDVEPIASDKPSKLPFKICNIFGCVHEENLKFVILTDSIQFQAAEIELVAKEYPDMALDFILSRMSKIPSLLSITEYSADKLSVLRTVSGLASF
uniref:Uncharacterized protein n=1 Tax=Panagrolaimus sp. ES5 TaxID=591445 RepID=A0AC34G0S5_9BILA